MSYMDRALKSRDPRYAQVLGKLGYERRDMVATGGEESQAPTTVAATNDVEEPKAEAQDAMAGLRAEYKVLIGKRPFPGWDAETLREKIREARKGEE